MRLSKQTSRQSLLAFISPEKASRFLPPPPRLSHPPGVGKVKEFGVNLGMKANEGLGLYPVSPSYRRSALAVGMILENQLEVLHPSLTCVPSPLSVAEYYPNSLLGTFIWRS